MVIHICVVALIIFRNKVWKMKFLKFIFVLFEFLLIGWGIITLCFELFSLHFGILPLKKTQVLGLFFLSLLYFALFFLHKKCFISKKFWFVFCIIICCLFGIFAYCQCYPLTQFPKYLIGISTQKLQYLLYNTPAFWLFLGYTLTFVLSITNLQRNAKTGNGSVSW